MKTEKRGRCVNFGQVRNPLDMSGFDAVADAPEPGVMDVRERIGYLEGCRQNCIRKREWLRGEMRKACEDGDVFKQGELRRIMTSNYRRMARVESQIEKAKSTLGRDAKKHEKQT